MAQNFNVKMFELMSEKVNEDQNSKTPKRSYS